MAISMTLTDLNKTDYITGNFYDDVNLSIALTENTPLYKGTTTDLIYQDINNILNLGYGYNLNAHSSAEIETALETAGFPLSNDQKSLLEGWKAVANTSAEMITGFDIFSSESQAFLFLKSEIWKSGGYADRVLNKLKNEGVISSTVQDEPLLDSSIMSRQLAALISLGYNNTDLIGTNLINALKNNNYEEAWFEIRYGSNPNNEDGVAKRRDFESEEFGLFSDPNNVTQDQKDEVMSFLFSTSPYTYDGHDSQTHLEFMQEYESDFWKSAKDAISDYTLKGNDAKNIYFQDIFKPIAAELVDHYLYGEGTGVSGSQFVFNGDVVLGFKGDDGNIDSRNNDATGLSKYADKNDLLVAIDNTVANTLEGGKGNDVLIGGTLGDTLNGGDNNDYLFGKGGDDTLNGGTGNDHLYGGAGADILYSGGGDDYLDGGADLDTYYIDASESCHVTIHDTANNGGKIFIGSVDLSATPFKDIVQHAVGVKPTTTDYGTANPYHYNDDIDISLTYQNASDPSQSIAHIVYINKSTNVKVALDVIGFNTDPNMFGIDLSDTVPDAPSQSTTPYTVGDGFLDTYTPGVGDPQDIYFSRTRDVTESYLNYDESNAADLAIQGFNATVFPTMETSINYNAATFDDGVTGATNFEGANGNDKLNGKDWTGTTTTEYVWEDTTYTGDVLFGLDGDDVITGDGMDGSAPQQTTGDNDILIGGRGSDQIYGGGGDDWLFAAEQSYQESSTTLPTASAGLIYDHSQYGSINEALYKNGMLYDLATNSDTEIPLTLEAVDESNYLDGGDGDDRLVGASFNDTLIGGKGDDVISAGAGQDQISGGDDDDLIMGDSSQIRLYGSTSVGADFIAPDATPATGDYSRAYFYKDDGEGNAVLRYNNDLNNTEDQAEYNALFNDVIDGGSGDDTIYGEIGNDVISGGADDDVLFGDRQYNSGAISGLLTNEFQHLSAKYDGDDVIDGGTGNDQIIGGGGDDVLMGGDGDDIVYGDIGLNIYDIAGTGETAITAHDTGWWGNDIIFGGAGSDLLVGEGGDDIIDGGDGADYIYGDWAWLSGHEQDAAAGDTSGHFGADTLYGGAGADYLTGGGGNDTLEGGTDNDFMYGEDGDDTYIINDGDGQDLIDDTQGKNTLKIATSSVDVVHSDDGTVTIYTSADHENFVQMSEDSFATFKTLKNSIDAALTVTEDITTQDGGTDTVNGATSAVALHNDDVVSGLQLSQTPDELASHQLTVTFDGTAASMTIDTTDDSSLTINVDNWDNLGLVLDAHGFEMGFALDETAAQDGVISGRGGDDVLTGDSTTNDLLSGNGGNDTYVLNNAGDSSPVVDTIIDTEGSNTLQLAGTALHVDLSTDVDTTDPEAVSYTVKVYNGGDTSDYVQMDNDTWRTMSFVDAEDDAIDLPVEVLGDAGVIYSIDADSSTQTRTLTLADGMLLSDYRAIRSGEDNNDLLLIAHGNSTDPSINTEVIIKGFFATQPEGWTWNVNDSESSGQSLEDWVGEQFGDAYEADAADIAAALTRFNDKQFGDMQTLGLAKKSLGMGDDLSDGFNGNADTGVKLKDYNFTLLDEAPSEAGGAAFYTHAPETNDVTDDVHTYWEKVNDYKEVNVPGYYYTVPEEDLGGGIQIPYGGIPTLISGDMQVYVPAHTKSVVIGYHLEEHTTVDAVDIARGFNIQHITGGDEDHTIVDTAGGFHGTVELGNGNNTVVLHDTNGLGSGLGGFIQTGSGDDQLFGASSDDVFAAGEGTNYIEGGAGNDTYYAAMTGGATTMIKDQTDWWSSDGYHNFNDGFNNTLIFSEGIAAGDLSYRWMDDAEDTSNSDGGLVRILRLNYGGANVLVTIGENGYGEGEGGITYGIQNFKFSDGTTLTLDELVGNNIEGDENQYGAATALTTEADISIVSHDNFRVGSDIGDNLQGWSGDDWSGKDYVFGGAGDDTLNGGDGDDVLYGGSGDDTLDGGDGNDTASYDDTSSITGVAVSLAISAAQDTLGAGTDTLVDIENLTGSDYNDTLTGDDNDNILSGGSGNDTLEGGLGNNTLDGGDGNDTASYADAADAVTVDLSESGAQITGGAGTDTLTNIENLRGSDYDDTLTGNAADNILEGGLGNNTLDGGGGSDTVSYAHAADAVTIDLSESGAQITGGAGTDTLSNIENLTGSDHDDTLTGDDNNNILSGGLGDDILDGGAGDDTFTFALGDGNDTIVNSDAGDVISLDASLTPNKVYISRDGDDYLINFKDSSTDSIRIEGTTGANTIQFNDGSETVWTLDPSVVPSNDRFITINTNDRMGSGTSDAFILSDPSLHLLSNDDLATGDWQVVGVRVVENITPGVYFGDFFGSDVVLFLDQEAGSGLLEYYFQNGNSGPVYSARINVTFDDDTVLEGSSQADILDAMDGAVVTLDGKGGDDFIMGGKGTDTVLYRSGDGDDTLSMYQSGAQSDSLILIGNGTTTTVSDVSFEQDQFALKIHMDGDTVTVEDYFHAASGFGLRQGEIGSIKFFDNETDYNDWKDDPTTYATNLLKEWTPDDTNALRQDTTQLASTSGDDVITTYTYDRVGDELSPWVNYDNTVDGLAGNDTINTKDGNDILIGGLGDDTLIGGSGSDTYQFAVGDGQDTIENYAADANTETLEENGTPLIDEDVLEISGVTDYHDLWLHQSGNDLVVKILGGSDQITVKDWFTANDSNKDENELDKIKVSNGTDTWELTNNQASITDSGFDRLMQSMATWETNNSGMPTTAPSTLDDGASGNAYTSWVHV